MQRKIPPYQCTVGFAVRKPGSSVRRNRMRRLLREAYRQQKEHIESLCQEQELHLRCVFLIDGKRGARQSSYPEVRAAVGTILKTLQRTLKEE